MTCAAALVWPALAHAETPFRVAYESTQGCPDERAFVDEVRRRAPAARPALSGEQAADFGVTITREGDAYRGQLREGAAGDVERELSGASCGQVVDALAFIVALSLDPKAASRAEASAERPSADSLRSPEGAGTDVSPRGARAGRRGYVAGGVDALAVGAIAPAPAFGGAVFVETGLDREGLVDASLRLSGRWVERRGVTAGPGEARFRLMASQLDACPLRAALASSVALLPCVGVQLGVLTAGGAGVDRPDVSSTFWAAFDAVAHARWQWGKTWFGEVSGGLALPLARHRFAFERPHLDVYQVPPLGGLGAFGVGARFL